MSFRSKYEKIHFLQRHLAGINKPSVAYIAGFHTHNNLGDKAIYHALKSVFCPFHFIDLPKEFSERAYSYLLSNTRFPLLAGGTRIGGKESMINKVNLCSKLSDSLIVFGSGVDDPKFWLQRYGKAEPLELFKKWTSILSRCYYLGVRGPVSGAVLSDFGISSFDIIGDPALLLSEDCPPSAHLQTQKSIGINFGQMCMWGEREAVKAELCKLAVKAKDCGWNVLWFVLSPRDLKNTKEIARASNTGQKIYKYYTDYNACLGKMRTLDFFVGMKLHSVVLATVAYVPSIMLECSPKCLDYMASINQQDMAVRTDSVRYEEIWERIVFWSGSSGTLPAKLYSTIQQLKQRQISKAREIKQKFLGSYTE